MSSTPSADESAVILTNKLKAHEPCVFTKFGDGTLWWMSGNPVQSANGEVYRPGIDAELREAARTLAKLPHVYLGDQLTCSSGPYLEKEQREFIRWDHAEGLTPSKVPITVSEPPPPDRWLHMETVLIHRLTPELLEFYRVLKADQRKKVMCAGMHLGGVRDLLSFEAFLQSDPANEHTRAWATSHILATWDWDILLLAVGHASKLIAATLASKFPDRTIIELGSALDPLFVGRTRGEQIEPEVARSYFKELL
jgi:hypothetical protein